MLMESWFDSLRRISWKNASETEKAAVGIMAYEVASLMSKIVCMWQSLSERELNRLSEEITDSIGVKKLVAEDDDYLMDLALNEIIENFGNVAWSVARLGKKCTDPVYHRFEAFIKDPIANNSEWYGWNYRLKKMDRKVKKMERFVAVMLQMSQELEVQAELDQTLRRMQANPEVDRVKLLEFRQKVTWQHQEVRNLQEMSPWVRTYDYIVRLLIRSLLTILARIKYAFAVDQMSSIEGDQDSEVKYTEFLSRSHSFSASMHSSVYPSESNLCGSLGMSVPRSAVNRTHQTVQASLTYSKSKRLVSVGPFKGCMIGAADSPILPGCKPTGGGSMRYGTVNTKSIEKVEPGKSGFLNNKDKIYFKLATFISKRGLVNASPSTLGHAALALRYANIIKLIEKLASSPHLISLDARDDLYNMLPTSIRSALRARLKAYAKTPASAVYDASLAEEWKQALERILEWLAPLAHNTIRWQSERNFEKDSVVCRANVLLVQTLHFASQAKTEAAITELLVGLNYVSRFCKEHKGNSFTELSGGRGVYNDVM